MDDAAGATDYIDHDHIRIRIDLTSYEDFISLLETILHELCYTYQMRIGCNGGYYCGTYVEYRESSEHPACFVELSLHVEDLATLLHGNKIRLGRGAAYIRECKEDGLIPDINYVY
jgi:hypothetical protein